MALPMTNSNHRAVQAKVASYPEPPKALPVTLLSGFLGAGKTTLLQFILKSNHGLRIAVIVNDMAGINIDAATVRQTHRLNQSKEKVIALQNGCICCNLRGDLLEEILQLWKLQEFDYIIIESGGITEPEQVAETFDPRLSDHIAKHGGDGLDDYTIETLQEIELSGGLDRIARLDTAVTIIDAFTIIGEFCTDEVLSARYDNIEPVDERTVSDLMVDQIEFADVIILNKIDLVNDDLKSRIINMVQQLNHRAKILESSYAEVDLSQILNTKLFNLELAQTGYGWLQDLKAMTVHEMDGGNSMSPKSKSGGYNVQSMIYSQRRPFHPRRLFSFLHDKFILQMEYPDNGEEEHEDENINMGGGTDDKLDYDLDMDENNWAGDFQTVSNETILENKRKDPILAPLYRSKGEFFLATRPHRAGNWSQAGSMLTLIGSRPWFCTLPPEEYTTGDPQVDRLVAHDIKKGGEWGDRRQEIVFIGEKLNFTGLRQILDECVLTDEEFETWQGIMRNENEDDAARLETLAEAFADGFPDWPGDYSEHNHGHDHADHSHHEHPRSY